MKIERKKRKIEYHITDKNTDNVVSIFIDRYYNTIRMIEKGKVIFNYKIKE